MAINVLIVDDDKLIRDSLSIILGLDPELQVAGTAANGDEALQACLTRPVDVVLMDIRMPVCDGVAGTQKIKAAQPRAKVLILTTFDDDEYIFEALRNGASGYLLKNVSPDKISEAVKVVHSGNLLIHPDAANKLTAMLSKEKTPNLADYGLSEAEARIVELIAGGYSNREIARMIYLSEGTVKNYISDILSKLNLRDRTQIAIFYLKGK